MSDNVEQIVAVLRRIQVEGGPASFVIFSSVDGPYYVQFVAQDEPGNLYAEAVGNEYLKPIFALDTGQVRRLQSMGWHPPGPSCGCGNLYRQWQAASDEERRAIARTVVRTLEVYGVGPNRPIEVDLWLD